MADKRNNKCANTLNGTDGQAGSAALSPQGRLAVGHGIDPADQSILVSNAFSSAGANAVGSAFGASVRWYITAINFVRDSTAAKMTLSDGTSTLAMADFNAAGNNFQTFPTPLRTAANGTFSVDLSNAGQSFIIIYGWTGA